METNTHTRYISSVHDLMPNPCTSRPSNFIFMLVLGVFHSEQKKLFKEVRKCRGDLFVSKLLISSSKQVYFPWNPFGLLPAHHCNFTLTASNLPFSRCSCAESLICSAPIAFSFAPHKLISITCQSDDNTRPCGNRLLQQPICYA